MLLDHSLPRKISLTPSASCVLVMFVSAALISPDPSLRPDPSQAGTGAGTTPNVGRVLALVRKLIEYGQTLVRTLRQPAGIPGRVLASRFGTIDLALILARIIRGLRRAAALEEQLRLRAARGRDLVVAPVRLPRPARSRGGQAAVPRPRNPEPAGLPTVEQIAAEVRRRPVGAVIADICHDLGIMPGHLDSAFWQELGLAIAFYGGSRVSFFRGMVRRHFPRLGLQHEPAQAPKTAASPPSPEAVGTGPPERPAIAA